MLLIGDTKLSPGRSDDRPLPCIQGTLLRALLLLDLGLLFRIGAQAEPRKHRSHHQVVKRTTPLWRELRSASFVPLLSSLFSKKQTEGLEFEWPFEDASILLLFVLYALLSFVAVGWMR
jgi:hypothetical protein